MFKFLKKYGLLILLFTITVLLIIFKVSGTKQPQKVTPTPLTTSTADYKSLLPGISNEEQAAVVLGSPIKEGTQNGEKINEYKSTNKYRNHIIEFENDKISIIKEVVNTVDNKNSGSIISKYGIAPFILYDQQPSASFNLYVYPQNGIAYRGHEDGTILEIWYFSPTNIEDFINRWGQGYGKAKPNWPPQGY